MAISRKLLNEGEQVVVSMRTHPKVLVGSAALGVVLLVLGSAGTYAARFWTAHWSVALGIWVMVGLLALRYVAWPVLEWLTASYTFTDRRLITRSGIVTRRGHDVPLSRISDLEIEKHLITDRVFGCGTLVVTNASTHGRVVLRDIPRVEETKRLVHQLLHDRATEGTARDEGI